MSKKEHEKKDKKKKNPELEKEYPRKKTKETKKLLIKLKHFISK